MKKLLFCFLSLFLLLSCIVCADDCFSAQSMNIEFEKGKIAVRGSFEAQGMIGEKYNVFLATYNDGFFEVAEVSADFVIKEGSNSFVQKFDFRHDLQTVRAYLLTEKLFPICKDVMAVVDRQLIDWTPGQSSFYDKVSSEKYTASTDYSWYLEDDSNVNLIEGITIAANLHAMYNNNEITSKDPSDFEQTLEMDDASVLVDLSERNSVNLDGINFSHAEGGIDEEEGYLYCTSVQKPAGGYDPQIVINGLMLDTRNFNKITLRVKYENAPGSYVNLRRQTLQVFFKTNEDSSLGETKSIRYALTNQSDVTDWFEIELDLSSVDEWKDVVTGIRVDPLNNNAKFYLDYVKFSKSENDNESEWYDNYLDYAFDNGIVTIDKYSFSKLEDEITRKEFFEYLVKAYPEEYFVSINDGISGIPDVDKNEKNAEVYLMLYRAGITLGFDRSKNLKLSENIKRSQAIGIVNRLLVPENRLKGTVKVNWDETGTEYDFEFSSSSDSGLFNLTRATVVDNSDGKLKLNAQRDAYLVYNNTCSLDSERYSRLRIRMKAEYDTPPTSNIFEFFFIPEGGSGYGDYCITTAVDDYYLDAMGWYIFEIDLSLHTKWKGIIKNLRFDLINDAGTYTLDYIRFLENPCYGLPDDHEGLIAAGYTATRLMPDEHFENGFAVSRVDQSVKWPEIHGMFNEYCSTINPDYTPENNKPMWLIGPWWQGTGEGFSEMDLIENRDTTKGMYVLADTFGVNTITYDPEEKSITQRLNATKIYNGEPHDADTYKWWPHQLIDTTKNYSDYVDMEVNSADADRMFVELDIRLLDFKNTTNPEGTNVCSYLAYFYFRPKSNPAHKIWFGLTLFSTSATASDPVGLTASTSVKPNWAPDSAAHQYMYGMPMAVVYDGIENSFNPSKGVALVSDEWKHIRLDITPHIDRAVEWANRDNIFGMQVTKEEMFFDGVNIGYEIHGNYDCTFEFKNFNMVAYNKD